MFDNVENEIETISLSGGELTLSGVSSTFTSAQQICGFFGYNITPPVSQSSTPPPVTITPGNCCNPSGQCCGGNITTELHPVVVGNQIIDAGEPQYSYNGFYPSIKTHETCPDCKGTKKYVGFNKIEPCVKCKGQGTI